MNGSLAVARYTLIELSRRRILLVFFILGALGIALVGFGLFFFSTSFTTNVTFGPPGTPQDPAKLNRFLELMFVSNLIGALGLFALLIAFAIGMTVIYHDLDSGAAVAIFSKPVSRLAFTVGKLLAAIASMIAIVGVLGVEARLLMFLFGSGAELQQTLWAEIVARVANAVTLMLIIMALSTWMNNIVAGVVGFIYHGAAGVVVALHAQMLAGFLGDNAILRDGLNVLYWLVPHDLVSDAQRQLVRAEFELFRNAGEQGGPTLDQMMAAVPGASGTDDIVWWLFVVAFLAVIGYIAVRRRQV
jgi:ABC-type transport system involved in multi-copper enzyme maturation permease subunit